MSKFTREAEEVNPNLIPIMNLFTALIPFLLMSAVFYRLSVIQISVPIASEETGETDIAKEEDKITLNLQIFPDRFDLSASSDTIMPDVLKKLKASIPRPAGRNDDEAQYQQVSQAAYRIKQGYASSETVIVVPEDDIPYEVVIFAMDAVRDIRIERDGEEVLVGLFGRAVLSSRVK